MTPPVPYCPQTASFSSEALLLGKRTSPIRAITDSFRFMTYITQSYFGDSKHLAYFPPPCRHAGTRQARPAARCAQEAPGGTFLKHSPCLDGMSGLFDSIVEQLLDLVDSKTSKEEKGGASKSN
jgi:hypothetical protein